MRAMTTGLRVKRDLAEARRALANQLEIATGDDLAELKREMERLEAQVEKLREESADPPSTGAVADPASN